jgi:large subunit ribosomal protein MRP49
MTINRTTDQKGPATMTIHFADPITAANTPPAVSSTTTSQTSSAPVAKSTPMAPTERTATINMKHRHESQILSQLLAITKAVPIEPTKEELEQIRELEEQQKLSEQDSKRSQAVNAKRKRTEAMLAQARGEVAAAGEGDLFIEFIAPLKE